MEPTRQPFSERLGLMPIQIQTDGMDRELRSSIWNFVRELIPSAERPQSAVVKHVTVHILRIPVERVGLYPREWLEQQVAALPWPRVYDLLELTIELATDRATAMEAANRMLERAHSGFRFIAGRLTRNIDPAEVAEVEQAMMVAKKAGFDGVHQHITQALELFGKRPEPDYRNAVKEAISAVEGTVKLIHGVRGGGISDALDALAEKAKLHPAFKGGLEKLYGFTSDASGIRHPLMEASTVAEEDARFMIVTCSAAVNWIIVKAENAGLLRKG